MKLGSWYQSRAKQSSTVTKTEPRIDASLPKTLDILKVVIDLNKAMDEKDWQTLYNAHSPTHSKLADPTYHLANSDVSQSYKAAMSDKNATHKTNVHLSGISTKVVHKINDDTFMTKPYMSGNDHRDEAMSPGWSIMTNRNLYHAGGIGHLVEDVHAHTHKQAPYIGEIPVTVHKFAPNFQEVYRYTNQNPDSPSNVNPLHARQIGLMDYLTGNYDRHDQNLLVGNHKTDGGYRPLLAIDHDRSFNYLYTRADPHTAYAWSAMGNNLKEGADQEKSEHDGHLAKWWSGNKHNIYGEMNRNLQAVKDDKQRNYIRKNFDNRFRAISQWSDKYNNGDTTKGMFNVGGFDGYIPEAQAAKEAHPTKVAEILQTLPKDKNEGMELLTDMFSDADIDPVAFNARHRNAIAPAVSALAKEMSPAEFVRFYSRSEHNDNFKKLKTDILMDMKNEPEKYATQLAEALKVNKNLPDEAKFLHSFWEKHIEKILSEQQSPASLKEAQ